MADSRAVRERREVLCGVPESGLRGLWGHPFVSAERFLELGALEEVHEEVCLALAHLPVDYTGGSHRSMGIMPPGLEDEAQTDYGELLETLPEAHFQTLRSLADDPAAWAEAKPGEDLFGEERALPLSRRQMLYLEYRFGVYFPWKVFYELRPNRWWGDKAEAEGKRFTRLAEQWLPKTIKLVRSLPFARLGRCTLMGLKGHDHGTVHRDGEPAEQRAPDHFLTLVPGPAKGLYLWDAQRRERVPVRGRAYWFNDFDYHGVEAAPDFRYSLRVDGVFTEDFLATLAEHYGGSPL